MTDYKSLFADIIGDVGDELPDADERAIEILDGFEQAIISWMKYHEDAAARYRELHRRFLLQDKD